MRRGLTLTTLEKLFQQAQEDQHSNMFLQLQPQPGKGSRHLGFNGFYGDVEPERDLLVAKAVCAAELEDPSAFRGQALQGLVEILLQVFRQQRVIGIDVVVDVLAIQVQDDLGRPAPDLFGVKKIQAAIAGSGEQIFMKRFMFIYSFPLLPQVHEQILNDLFSILLIVQKLPCIGTQPGIESSEQQLQTLRISIFQIADQVGMFHNQDLTRIFRIHKIYRIRHRGV